MSDPAPLLRALGISKSFGGTQVLHSVDFDLHPGEVHALVGENGAGKSTLLKIIGGIHLPETGEMMLGDHTLQIASPGVAQQLGIALIHQEPLTFPDLDVAENIFVGHEGHNSRFKRVNWSKMYAEAQRLLDSLGVALDPRQRVRGLSIADQQMVEVASALAQNARILLMDEPTSSLTPNEVGDLFRIVRRLRDQGTAIVFISHRLEEVFEISDRITVLRDGEMVGTRRRGDTTLDEVIRMMVGRPLSTLFEKGEATIGEPLLEVEGLCRAGFFADISFEVRKGEIVGVFGLVGAGRTDVANALFGINPPDSGTVRIDGKPVTIRSPKQMIELGIGYVPEDRQHHGLFLPFPVSVNATMAILDKISPGGWFRPKLERQMAISYCTNLRVHLRDVAQATSELSGGNQQKVVLAKWLVTEPSILILDEPTRGIDIGAKSEVHHLIGELARQGKAILMISSEMPEILAMSDRVVVMREGRINGRFGRKEATAEAIIAAATGQTLSEVNS